MRADIRFAVRMRDCELCASDMALELPLPRLEFLLIVPDM